jgi:rhodanese-related sulfurtransferase
MISSPSYPLRGETHETSRQRADAGLTVPRQTFDMAKNISVLEAQQLVEHGAVLLDVREDFEWEDFRAPGALHIPMAQLSTSTDRLPPNLIACICLHGNRSEVVAEALVGAGYEAVNVAGGMIAWEKAGLPVERG